MFFPLAFVQTFFPSPKKMTLQQSMAFDKDIQERISLLQPKYQEKFKNRSQEDIDAFIKNNPDPNKVTIACLIERHPDWKEAHNTLKNYIEDKSTFDDQKTANISRMLAFNPTGLPKHLDERFIKESWAIHLFIAVSSPAIFNLLLSEPDAAEMLFMGAAYNPNVSYYLLNTDDRCIKACGISQLGPLKDSGWIVKQPELATYVLKSNLLPSFILSRVLNVLGESCGFSSASNSNLDEQQQEKRIIEWVPEKIMLDTIFSLFGHDANKLDNIVKRKEQGLSEDKLKEAIQFATQGKSLTEPKGQNGNNIFHLACFYEARKTFGYLLEQVMQSNNNPQEAIESTLSIKNQEDETPYDLCSLAFQQEMKDKVSNLLKESKTSPRP